jgi:hypothetical protein
MTRDEILKDLPARVGRAVAHYWEIRATQRDKQRQAGRADQGLRSAVTGGAHMDRFIDFFTELIVATGIPTSCVHRSKDVELPGFFRPTKEWDLLVIRENTLLVAIEAKSQVGPSFGNNFNNRTEEAMGSALDLWTAYREHAYSASPQPFLGYFFSQIDQWGFAGPLLPTGRVGPSCCHVATLLESETVQREPGPTRAHSGLRGIPVRVGESLAARLPNAGSRWASGLRCW